MSTGLAELTEVIRKADTESYHALKQHERIAAAVAAHLASPAVVERAARAARPDAWAEDGEIGNLVSADAKAKYYAGLRKVAIARTAAALAAAVGGDGTEGRGG